MTLKDIESIDTYAEGAINTDNDMLFYNAGLKDGAAITKEELIHNFSNWLYDNFYEHPHEKNFICSEAFKSMDKMIDSIIDYIS